MSLWNWPRSSEAHFFAARDLAPVTGTSKSGTIKWDDPGIQQGNQPFSDSLTGKFIGLPFGCQCEAFSPSFFYPRV